MTEADFQTKYNRWVKNVYKKTHAFELKITKTNSIPFSAVKDHQIRWLYAVKHGVVPYKIADVGYDQKPFDGFAMAGEEAVICIMFYTRGTREFYMIDIDVFMTEMRDSVRRSLTEERAREIGRLCTLGTLA